MKKVLTLLLLLVGVQAQAQFSHPIITFNLSLSGYSGRFDTTRGVEFMPGSPTVTGIDVSLTTSDTALGAAGGLAADYGWFSHVDGGTEGVRFNQLSILVDTMSAKFTNVLVVQHDTIRGPALDAMTVTDRVLRLNNVPFQMTQPGVFTASLSGAELAAHLTQPVLVHTDRYFRQELIESLDFSATSDSVTNASVTVSVQFPTAAVQTAPSTAELTLWPNPVASELHVEGVGQQPCRVYDALGRSVLIGQAPALHLESLPAGTYFVEVGGRLTSIVVAR